MNNLETIKDKLLALRSKAVNAKDLTSDEIIEAFNDIIYLLISFNCNPDFTIGYIKNGRIILQNSFLLSKEEAQRNLKLQTPINKRLNLPKCKIFKIMEV